MKTRSDAVVFRQVKIDDLDVAGAAALAVRRGLEQPPRQMMRFGQKKEADLSDVRARRDVNQVIFGFGVEGVIARKAEKGFVHLLEVPGIFKPDWAKHDFRFRGNGRDVPAQLFGEGGLLQAMEKFEAIDNQIGLLADGDRRSPVLPAVRMLAQIEGGSEQSNDDNRQWHPIHIYKSIDTKIVFENGRICLYAQTTQMKQHTPSIEFGHLLALFMYKSELIGSRRMNMANESYNVYVQDKGVPVKAWTKGVPLEDQARQQLLNAAQMPFIFQWVAVMPDVHRGIGATVGSVIPTRARSSRPRSASTSAAA